MAFQDFGIDQTDLEFELNYLPMELISIIDSNKEERFRSGFICFLFGAQVLRKSRTRQLVSGLPLLFTNFSNVFYFFS